jgi:hypothetical protein
LRQAVRRDLLTESRKHGATKLLCQILSIGPIRAALAAIVSSPQKPSSAVVPQRFLQPHGAATTVEIYSSKSCG